MQHTAVCGAPGTAKADALATLVQADIAAGCGLLQVDFDGDATKLLLASTPASRTNDVVLIDLADVDYPAAINPLAIGDDSLKAMAADNLVDTIRAIAGYDTMATPDMDRTIYNSARAVFDLRGGTILDLYKMLVDDETRERVVQATSDPIIAGYWREQFARLDPRDQAFVTKSTINKLEPFVADARVRNVLCQHKPLIDLGAALAQRKIICISIPLSIFGVTKARLLGGLLLSPVIATLQRRRGLLPLHVHLPNARYIPPAMLQSMLATLGARNVSLNLGFQYLNELGSSRDPIIGGVGNWLIGRMGLQDAETLEMMFPWDNTTAKIHELNAAELHLIRPGVRPLKSVTVIGNLNNQNHSATIVKRCRHFYCRPRDEVEAALAAKLRGTHESRHQTG
ncbi:MAG: hypothetical protein AAFR71_02685 [Pseudomonadota bacterium]